ncbi:2-C-methyl-D-erythritol 4-phosphate cytidylyltransferase, putative [Hepatocystis sp. ex Piliocolobus tephrosceles]|nr:2-C-methyl-D-erythritol 4-phosphate cytidylyltransferase, putative [Hepatocystis sp. ex Piliocolobus tephrosceles]
MSITSFFIYCIIFIYTIKVHIYFSHLLGISNVFYDNVKIKRKKKTENIYTKNNDILFYIKNNKLKTYVYTTKANKNIFQKKRKILSFNYIVHIFPKNNKLFSLYYFSSDSPYFVNLKKGKYNFGNAKTKKKYSINIKSINNGSINNGSINNGLINNGSINNGSINNGSINNGSINNGSINNGSINNGSINNGSINNGSINNGSINIKSINNGSIKNGSIKNGSIKNGSIKNGSIKNGSIKNGSIKNGSIKNVNVVSDNELVIKNELINEISAKEDIVDSKKKNKQTNKKLESFDKNIRNKKIHAILLCGGIGTRTELNIHKQYLKLEDIPIFIYPFNLFIKCNFVKSISLVCDIDYFSYVIDSINKYNLLLLKKKNMHNFLGKIKKIENTKTENIACKQEVEPYEKNENENDEIMTNRVVDFFNQNQHNKTQTSYNILKNIKTSKIIIYDNNKCKCILDTDELLQDILDTSKKDARNKKVRIKLKHIDTNRYKIIRIVQNGDKRLDSFLNALKLLDIYKNNKIYIYELIQKYVQTKQNTYDNILFDDIDNTSGFSTEIGNVLNQTIEHTKKQTVEHTDLKEVNHTNITDSTCSNDFTANGNDNNKYYNDIKNTSFLKKKKKKYITDILIHDSSRPFLSELDFFNVIYYSSLDKNNNIILGTKATDSIKFLSEKGKNMSTYHLIKKNIDRTYIFQAQTPQMFKSEILLNILRNFFNNIINSDSIKHKHTTNRLLNTDQFTDVSSLVQALTKKKVYALQSTLPNFKITTPHDVINSFHLMNNIFYNNKTYNSILDKNIFKKDYINSDCSNILTNQFNNYFFYNNLNEKQKLLYQHFYYKKKNIK